MEFPMIGIGSYKVKPQDQIDTMLSYAFRTGYTMIDTAEIYRNQKYIGNFLKNHPEIDRTKLWITSKVNFINVIKSDENEIIKSINQTFIDLKTDYIDLYLIHCPIENTNLKIWDILRNLQKEGRIRHIGVSNFTYEKLKQFIEEIGPIESKHIFCNQIEFNPFLNRKELINYCFENNIKIVAYGSLNKKNDLIESIANKLNKTQEQVLLKWALQNNVHIIPMALDPRYINDNFSLHFDIPEEDMDKMNSLNENYAVFAKYL